MFPINRQTRIKTSRLPTVTKCDTRFRNNAKFASFDVLYSQREFRVVPKKLTVSFTVVSRVVPVFAGEEKEGGDIVYFCSMIWSRFKNFNQLSWSLESERLNRAKCIHIIQIFCRFAQNIYMYINVILIILT